MTPTKQKKVLLFNASGLKNMDCARKIYYTMLQGYTQPMVNNDTHYGTCYHLYQSVLAQEGIEGIGFAKAMKAAERLFRDTVVNVKPKKEYLDITHLRKTCVTHYNEILPTDDFEILSGKQKCRACNGSPDTCLVCQGSRMSMQPLVELKFHVPYYSDEYLDVILTATIDKLGKFKNGAYGLGDYKSTGSWKEKEFLENYALDPQLMFYLYMLKRYAAQYPDSVFAEICQHQKVGAFVDGVFHGASKETSFKRSEVFFYDDKPERMKEFEEMLHDDVMKCVKIHKEDRLPKRQGIMTKACTSSYSTRCQYFNACNAPNDAIAGHVLKNNFVQKEYGMSVYGGEVE